MFIAKLPTFEKRCETPAGTVEVEDFPLCLTETNRRLQERLEGKLDVLLCSDCSFSVLCSLHFHLFLTFVLLSAASACNMIKVC